jgi:hypothetical protein
VRDLPGFCTAKGRLLALLLIWREGDDFLLMLPRDILPMILKKLSMYVLRSKVKLSDATAERVLIGCSRPAVSPAPTLDIALELPRFGVCHFGRPGHPPRRYALAAGTRRHRGDGALAGA